MSAATIDYLGLDSPDDFGAGRIVADAAVQAAMSRERTPVYDAVKAAQIRRYWTEGPGAERPTFPGGVPVQAGDPVTCPGCGRTTKTRRDGAPVRHKTRKGGDWCPGR